jgi:hypothetical protein
MTQRAPATRAQEVRPPVTRISLRAKTAAVNCSITAANWSSAETANGKDISIDS